MQPTVAPECPPWYTVAGGLPGGTDVADAVLRGVAIGLSSARLYVGLQRRAGMDMSELRVGDEVRVSLRDGCPGGNAPHHSVEDGTEGEITALTGPPDHPDFVLFRRGLLPPSAAFPRRLLGRHYAGEELERVSAGK